MYEFAGMYAKFTQKCQLPLADDDYGGGIQCASGERGRPRYIAQLLKNRQGSGGSTQQGII